MSLSVSVALSLSVSPSFDLLVDLCLLIDVGPSLTCLFIINFYVCFIKCMYVQYVKGVSHMEALCL